MPRNVHAEPPPAPMYLVFIVQADGKRRVHDWFRNRRVADGAVERLRAEGIAAYVTAGADK